MQHNLFIDYGSHIWKSIEKLEEQLEKIRKKGCAQPHFKKDKDYRLAVPVFDSGNYLLGALGAFIPNTNKYSKDTNEVFKQVTKQASKLNNL